MCKCLQNACCRRTGSVYAEVNSPHEIQHPLGTALLPGSAGQTLPVLTPPQGAGSRGRTGRTHPLISSYSREQGRGQQGLKSIPGWTGVSSQPCSLLLKKEKRANLHLK